MSPLLVVLPKGKSRYIVLSPTGELIIPAHNVQRLRWRVGTKIRVSYLESPLILVLGRVDDESGYRLHSIGHDDESESASKIRIAKLVNDVRRVRIKLPVRGMETIFLPPSASHIHELAITLEPWDWNETTFDVADVESIPSKLVGLYEILSNEGHILKIGEGQLTVRMREAMKITDLARAGRMFRYLTLEKADAELLEQIALAEYRGQFNELPPFNPINQ